MIRSLLLTATLLSLLACLPLLAQQGADVVVLPFENLSGVAEVSREVSGLVVGALSNKGWRVANPEPLGELLRSERVRYLDFLDGEVRTRVLRQTNSGLVLTGTIYEYSSDDDPTVALAARLVTAAGELLWSNVAIVSSSETETLFGFGRKSTPHEVAVAAATKLISPLPSERGSLSPTRGPKKPRFRSSQTFYVAPDALVSAPKVICVLPFVDESQSQAAGRVVTDILSLRLAAMAGFSVVDSARMRAAVRESGIGSFRQTRPQDLEALADRVGTPLFLRGTIYDYGYVPGTNSTPRLSIELTLENVSTGRILWVAQYERRGSDYEGLFLLGGEVSTVGLADRVVSEMVDAAEDALRDGRQAESAGLDARRRSDLRGVAQREHPSQTGGVP